MSNTKSFSLHTIVTHFLVNRVKRAIEVSSNKEVAVKILKTYKTSLSRKAMLESFVKEIKILTYCRHPNIVRLIDASLDGVLIKEAIT